jgi:hypothetical protein
MAKAKQAVAVKVKAATLESKVQALVGVQSKIDKQNLLLKALNTEYDALERNLFEAMQQQGLKQVGTGKSLAYIANKVFTKFTGEAGEGFDAFINYVFKHKAADLLHRRVNQAAWKSRLEAGETIPGVEKVEIPTIHLRRGK